MSRAHVRRTIHDKRESFRLKERERGRVFRGREGADDLTNCSRNESSRLALPCAASCVFSSDVSLSRVDRRYMYIYVCMYSRSSKLYARSRYLNWIIKLRAALTQDKLLSRT